MNQQQKSWQANHPSLYLFLPMPIQIAGANDCIYSISARFGYPWATLWDHPENKHLREQGRSPHCLQKGDSVFIPPITPKFVTVSTGKAHKFTLSLPPVELRLLLHDEYEKPRKNLRYELTVENKLYQGQTDEAGKIFVMIPAHATQATLRLFEQRDEKMVIVDKIDLNIGALDPAISTTGVQGRLQNLGIPCGRIDGKYGSATREGVANFQRSQALPVDGESTYATQQALIKCHEHED